MNLPTPPAPVFDVTQDNFEAEVLQASLETPVLLDFWAEWCGPCKALGPVLEKLTGDYQGAFRLGKVDVDSQQALAQAFGIRSIPTVMLVKDGKPVDGFSGALPEGQVREFLGQHLPPVLAGDTAPVADQPEPLTTPATTESPEQAIERLRGDIAEHPDQTELRWDLIHALLQADQADAAENELANLPEDQAGDARTASLRKHLELARTLQDAPDLDTLQQRVQADGCDWNARDLLGVRLLLGADPGAGLEQFLHVLKHAPQWQDGQAKTRLLAAFEALDNAALVGPYRRRMTSLLF